MRRRFPMVHPDLDGAHKLEAFRLTSLGRDLGYPVEMTAHDADELLQGGRLWAAHEEIRIVRSSAGMAVKWQEPSKHFVTSLNALEYRRHSVSVRPKALETREEVLFLIDPRSGFRLSCHPLPVGIPACSCSCSR
jgi:hypothetical protein